MRRFKIHIDGGVWIFGAFLLLLLPLPWVIAMLLAATFHELGHAAAAKWLRIPVKGIHASPGGVQMFLPGTTARQECICALGGPIFGMILVLLFPVIPKIGFCALIHTVYNLIPFSNSDGYRIMKCCLKAILGEVRTERILLMIRIVLILLGSLFLLRLPGLMPAALILMIWNRWGRERVDKWQNGATLKKKRNRRHVTCYMK
jgi:Zn-dependent protease